MKTSRQHSQRGSAFATTIIIVAVLAILTGSLLSYSISERRANEHHRLVLRARNMSENVSIYAAEQLTTKLYRLRSTQSMAFMEGENKVELPPNDSSKSDYVSSDTIVPSSLEVRAAITASTPYEYVDPALPANAGNPNIGLQVGTTTVPIISKATANSFSAGTYTSYVRQDMEVALIPLFQFGIFYNMDLEFFPGQNMSVGGPVHTNGRLMARGEVGGTATLSFGNRVTAAQGLYANGQMKVTYRRRDGTSETGDGGSGAVNFTPVGSTTLKNLYGDSKWRDHRYGGTTETTTSLNQFKSFATSTYLGNLRTNVHGVTKLELPAIGTYSEKNLDTTPEDDRNNGRQIIEAPNTMKYVGGSWVTTDDATSGVAESKISRSTGLYIVVNPDDAARNGRLPDGASITMPARSYRAWLNTVNTNGTRAYREVVLPGQPSYYASASGSGEWVANPNPNAYRTDTSVGSNQILRIGKGSGAELAGTGYDNTTIPTFPALTDAYFYDLRRANGNRGYPYDRATYNYTPRAVAKIDFDMTRFKMMINRTLSNATTSSVYNPARPHNGIWANSVFNSATSVTAGNFGLGTGNNYDEFPTSTPVDYIPWAQNAATPANITISAFSQVGAGAPSVYNGRIQIAWTKHPSPNDAPDSEWTAEATPSPSGSDVSQFVYTPRPEATATRIRLFKGGAAPGGLLSTILNPTSAPSISSGSSAILDEQIILHVPDLAPLGVGTSDPTRLRRFRISEATATSGSTPTFIGTTFTSATWTTRYTSAADESFRRYIPTSSSVTAVRVEEFPAGSTPPASVSTTLKTLPRYQMVLSNDFASIPTALAYLSPNYSTTTTDVRVFDAGVDDTSNWTFSYAAAAAATGITGGFGKTSASLSAGGSYVNGDGYNRFWLTGMTSNTGGVRIRATKGSITLDRVFYLAKIGGLPILAASTRYWLTITRPVAIDPFKMYFANENPNDTPVPVQATDLISESVPSPWFDGVTVFIHSIDAERRAQSSGVPDRVDSGVRLWNARGPVPSLTITNRTGLTFVTNDAAYIVGHFNADGKNLVSDVTSTSYSGRVADSTDEKLACVMADAITILSQPVFNSSYVQTSGWNDALSGHRVESSGWSTNWRTTSPGGSNSYEGSGDTVSVRNMPNIATSGLEVTTRNQKYDPIDTEVSAALLMGLVPSNHNPTGLTDGPMPSLTGNPSGNQQYSGGAHNFPRLLEPWNGFGLYIRGSMVALFESRVAMEPWNLRVYSAPNRYWGLHEGLSAARHDVPLEPIVLNAQRKRYREITKAEYDAQKTIIEALPR